MSGIVLAGGKSTRMGIDKSRLIVNGMSMLDAAVYTLSRLFTEIIICGTSGTSSANIIYAEDIYKGIGPIGGVYTGLHCSSQDVNFVTACDIPGIDISIIKYMISVLYGHDACIIKIGEYVEPLFGCYRKRSVHVFREYIEKGGHKISGAFEYMAVRYVSDYEIGKVSPGFRGLYNINTPRDYEDYIKLNGGA